MVFPSLLFANKIDYLLNQLCFYSELSKEKLNFSCILLGTFYKSISKSIETRNMKYYKKLKEI